MSSGNDRKAAVLGAGSWGTALAIHLGSVGHDVALWGRDQVLIAEMAARRANPTYLPDITFPDWCGAERVARGRRGRRPAHHRRRALARTEERGPGRRAVRGADGAVFVSATKGLETDSLDRMSDVIREETGGRHPVVVLSGPSFAAEVARHLPTALVAASDDATAVASVQEAFRGPTFRLYGSDDMVGVEIGASLKNIIAIAAGVTESMDLGHNAMAALITRGLAEISRAGLRDGRPPRVAGGLERTRRSRC